jgi:foldase protein PrsA
MPGNRRYHRRAMRFLKSVLALGAFFVAVVGLSACGSSVPGNSVANVAGNPVSLQAFNHWMYVAAAGNSAQSPGSPVIVPNDPPNFNACVAQARKEIPALAKTPAKSIRQQCQALFTSLSGQVMDFLIRAYWYQSVAHNEGVKVTDAEVQKQFNQDKKQAYPTEAQFQQFLKQSGQTAEDVLYRVKVNLLYMKLIQKHTPKVTAAQVASYYSAHMSQFGTPESRNIRIVLTKTKAQADAAKAALEHGQSWQTVAKKYSTDASKNNGGLLTNVTKGQQDAALDQAAFSSPTGKVFGPIKGQFGYYVFEVESVKKGTQQTLEQATPTIQATLKQQAQTTAQNTVDNLAKKAYLHQTTCRKQYSMADCTGYKAPKTPVLPGGAAGGTGAGAAGGATGGTGAGAAGGATGGTGAGAAGGASTGTTSSSTR